VALGSLTYGYSTSIISTTLSQPSFNAYFEFSTRSNTDALIGAVFGLYQTGGFFGTMACLKAADFLGRRRAMFYASLVTVLGGALQAGSAHIGMYIAARFITGLGSGTWIYILQPSFFSSLHFVFDLSLHRFQPVVLPHSEHTYQGSKTRLTLNCCRRSTSCTRAIVSE
jgi:MFS family permease